ncbi:hypothetical protein Mpet_1561 [Methanolacinia petrolearia DSM 11571]|uniref:Uncharacterized protein n=1 Tax=Methanolacinia petrolearia (strain DSM 11571 / OCM 486 / SEBR 4847) TaxID=679926 RepID=E1RGM3_METP4|nr:hypothetical protein [Methanolacinia petrolearia]ADN36318.1 hypothetical protein Mpet_1561 [Methanolacinia petrolearia DSM 11571]
MKARKEIRAFSLLLAVVFVTALIPVVNAEQTYENIIVDSNEVEYKAIIDNMEITVIPNNDFSKASMLFKSEKASQEYTVTVKQSENGQYIANIYSKNGVLVGTKEYSENPLISEKGSSPLILRDIPYILDAEITITPDKYSYTLNQYGTVNIEVQNTAPDGETNYYLKIPEGVDYISVYHGKQPNMVVNIDSGETAYFPECGGVNGPCTVLYWMDLHTFDYNEEMKVRVQFSTRGQFVFYAYDHEQEVLTGIPTWDDDQYTVTVS